MRNVWERHIKPSDIIKHLITTRQSLSFPITTQSKTVMRRQWFQDFRPCKVLRGVFPKLIVQSLTCVNNLHGLVINLHTDAKSTFRKDILNR